MKGSVGILDVNQIVTEPGPPRERHSVSSTGEVGAVPQPAAYYDFLIVGHYRFVAHANGTIDGDISGQVSDDARVVARILRSKSETHIQLVLHEIKVYV